MQIHTFLIHEDTLTQIKTELNSYSGKNQHVPKIFWYNISTLFLCIFLVNYSAFHKILMSTKKWSE